MLFNSYEFLFQFLPPTLIGFFALGALGRPRAALFWLLGASLFFYHSWRFEDLWILLGSIGFNYCASSIIANDRFDRRIRKKVLIVGIAGNLSALAYFKYSAFFISNVSAVLGTGWAAPALVLPLGISFYTFQQIAFLVEAWRGEFKEPDLARYSAVVTFFPHLIAGPIINYRSVIEQFKRPDVGVPREGLIAPGITIFAMGLAKKVLLADSVAAQADHVFDAAAAGLSVSMLEAWTGALAYTLQLYFDFSGYSDMAIGLALILGIRLPLNFASPYKATNIVEFWRRWHMTLSRFLRDYLYIALGGNRRGPSRRAANLMITMVLGGLWHGAGWTFILWGALHGLYLIICQTWMSYRGRRGKDASSSPLLGRLAGWALTFLAVVVAWVFFRAASLESALLLCKSMFGFNGIELPELFEGTILASLATSLGIDVVSQDLVPHRVVLVTMACLLGIAFLAPNTQEWVGYSPEAGRTPGRPWMHRTAIHPAHGVVIGCLVFFTLSQLSSVNVFLYFQF